MLSRTYKASSQSKAAKKMQADGAPPGYVLVGQSWAQGGRTCAASGFVVVGVLLLIIGIVFPPLWVLAIVFLVIGLVSGKGDGELTVTWQPAPAVPVHTEAPPPPAPVDHAQTLTSLKDMLDRGAITQADYDAKKAEILGRM